MATTVWWTIFWRAGSRALQRCEGSGPRLRNCRLASLPDPVTQHDATGRILPNLRPTLDSEVSMIFDGPALFLVVLLICAAALAVRS